MLPYEVYKVLHLLGVILMFTMLGGIALHVVNGGTRESNTGRRLTGALHGVALFVILLGGFGMLMRHELAKDGLPGWVWAKLGIWVLLGALGSVAYRRPAMARPLLIGLPLIGALAAWLAIFKPI
jgi:hypothetical protein